MKYRSPTPKCSPTIFNRNEDEAARIRESLAISRDIVLQRNSPLTRSPRESSLSASARPEALGENSCMIPDERSRSVRGDDPRVTMTGRATGIFFLSFLRNKEKSRENHGKNNKSTRLQITWAIGQLPSKINYLLHIILSH